MNKQEFIAHIDNQLGDRGDMIEKKNDDYTGGSDDPFACWRGGEAIGVTVEMAIKWEIIKKRQRLLGMLSGHSPNFESIEDTETDIDNYKMILKAWEANDGDN